MFLGTILLERNRWRDPGNPLFWLDAERSRAIGERGFSGIELWAPHYLLAPEAARAVMPSFPCPARIFSSYIRLAGEGGEAEEARLVEAARAFAGTLRGIKFNFGPDAGRREAELEAARRIAAALPPGVMMLCECHSGTWAEEPETAAEVFAGLPEERFGVIVHPFTQPRLREWFRLLGPRIRHLHLQARDEAGGWLRPRPGERGVDEGLAVLAEWGFRGTATLEFTKPMTEEMAFEALLDEAAADMRSLLPRLSLGG